MVMLLAVGVAAYSMVKKNAGVASASASRGDNEAVSMTEIRLGSVEEAEKLATERDVTFLVLPGQDASSTNAAQERVSDAFGKLLLQGQKAAAFTLPQSTGAYGALMKRFGVDSSPCVIVLGSAGPSSAVFGDITETKLLRAAVMAGLRSSCCPGGSCSSATSVRFRCRVLPGNSNFWQGTALVSEDRHAGLDQPGSSVAELRHCSASGQLSAGCLGALNPCCTAPVLGAVAGYSGSLAHRGGRRAIVLAGLCFMLGTFLALAIVGAATGFVSQLAGSSLGSYWKMFAGFVLVFFGLACLKLVPMNMPKLSSQKKTEPAGLIEAIVFGLLVGGSTTLCSAACNPTLAVTLGVATLQGQTLRGAAVLSVYGIGYSVPLAAAIIGLGLGVGKLTSLGHTSGPHRTNLGGRDPARCRVYDADAHLILAE